MNGEWVPGEVRWGTHRIQVSTGDQNGEVHRTDTKVLEQKWTRGDEEEWRTVPSTDVVSKTIEMGCGIERGPLSLGVSFKDNTCKHCFEHVPCGCWVQPMREEIEFGE